MVKLLIVALLCAPGWLLGGIVRHHASTRHPTPTARATATPAPTMTPVPTSTPLPTVTAVPTATAMPSNDPVLFLLDRINQARSQHGFQPLALSAQQTPRSQSHANAMQATGTIWHQNAAYPTDSFPATIYCYPFCASAENVGAATSYSEAAAVQADLVQMLSEPWTLGCVGNHACSLLSASYHSIGIGITYSGYTAFVVQDFIA